MKEIKNLADKDNAEILDTEFLEKTLCPMADANKAKQKRKFISISAALGVSVIAVFSVSFGILYHKDYTESYETKKSDVAYLNSTLTSTQLIGDFETINLTYETHHKTPVYFSVYRIEEGNEWMQSLSMKVIVQQGYEIDEIAYVEQFEFLGYTVYYEDSFLTPCRHDISLCFDRGESLKKPYNASVSFRSALPCEVICRAD